MSVNFGPNKEDVQENPRMPELSFPYCGEGYLKEVRKDEYGEDDKEVLVFQFVATDTDKFRGDDKEYNEVGTRHVEWPPRPKDLEEPEGGGNSPFQNAVNRIVYISKYFLGEEKAIKVSDFDADNPTQYWQKLRDRVVKAFENTDHQDKTIRFKVVGNVYNGNARLQFPRYLGFISDENSEQPVSFSDSEKDDNREYIAAVSETPDSSESFGGDEGDDELQF